MIRFTINFLSFIIEKLIVCQAPRHGSIIEARPKLYALDSLNRHHRPGQPPIAERTTRSEQTSPQGRRIQVVRA